MDNLQHKPVRSNAVFIMTNAVMYLTLVFLALSPIVVIWLAAEWLHQAFAQSQTLFSQNPRLYTVLTIIAVSAALTLLADKVYHHIKAQQKRQLEHI